MDNLADLYNAVVDNCVEEYNIAESARNLWLDSMSIVDMKDGKVYLATDKEYKQQTINGFYVQKLEKQFEKLLGVKVEVIIQVKDNLPTMKSKFENLKQDHDLSNQIDNMVQQSKVTYTFDNFIIGPSNNLAFAAAKAVAQKKHEQYNPLFIYGDSGLGKTHLLSAIQNEMKQNFPGINIIYTSSETFTNEFLKAISNNTTSVFDDTYRNADVLLIDDIQFIAGKEQTEEKFFHIFNELYKLNKPIVLTSDRPAKEIKSISDRLQTRFSSGLAADVRPPEYETRLAIIKRKAELLNIKIPEDTIDFIATKLKSNIRQIEGVVTKLNALYTLQQIKPNIVAAQNVINEIVADQQPVTVTVDKIINEVAKIFNVMPDEMRSSKRAANISSARKAAIYVIQDITGMPYEAIGHEFGDRDHSTIVYSIKNVKDTMASDASYKAIIEDLIKNIKANM